MTFAEQVAAYQDAIAAKQAVIDSLADVANSLSTAAQNASNQGDEGTASALMQASSAAIDAANQLADIPNPPPPEPPPPPPPPLVDEEGKALTQGPSSSGNQPGTQPDSGQSPPPSESTGPPPADPPSGNPSATPADGGGDDRDTGGRLPPGQLVASGGPGALLGTAGLASQLAGIQPGAGFTDPSPVTTVDEATRQLDAQVREASIKLRGFQAMLRKAPGHGSL
jgi:hypothetical protein